MKNNFFLFKGQKIHKIPITTLSSPKAFPDYWTFFMIRHLFLYYNSNKTFYGLKREQNLSI